MIETRHLAVRFGERVAVEDASVTVVSGAIHAVIGENGAGKSTLLGAMAGLRVPASGEVLVGGRPLTPATPREAASRGVAVVHQHFALVPGMTALENLLLGREPVGLFGRLLPSVRRSEAEALMQSTGLVVPLDARVETLGPGDKQRIEILRGLLAGAKALLLDEPTAVLVADEARALYRFLRGLADDGRAVVVVTHALADVVAHADTVTVLRKGRVVHQGRVAETDETALASVALGALPVVPRPPAPASDEPALALQAFEVPGKLAPMDLVVRRGEIVGVAGIEGAGQAPLVQGLAGLTAARGRATVRGERIDGLAVLARRRRGLETIHADRHDEGLVLAASVGDNLVLGDAPDDEAATVARRLDASGAEPHDPARAARTLSGGNQQKLLVARALDRHPACLVAAQPTRGIDARAAADVHAKLRAAAAEGTGVLLVSSDLAELRTLAHRLVVLARGRLVAELPHDVDEGTLGRAMMEVDG